VSKTVYFNSLPLAVTTDIIINSSIHYEYNVAGTVREINSNKENIYMPFTGKVIHLYVIIGQEVKTGDLLFNIDMSGITAEINQIEKLIDEKKQRMAQTNEITLIKEISVQIELLQRQLKEKNERSTHDVVFSPIDGIISKVNRIDGDKASVASVVVEITVNTTELKTSLSFPNNYRNFEVGETIMLKNNRNQDCTGIIRSITFNDSIRQLEVEFDQGGIYTGEQLLFSDSFTTKAVDFAVKTNNIRVDNSGYYILQLVREKTSLGEKFFAKRVDIYIGITVGEYTEILNGIDFLYPVITNPEIKDGMEIRIY
jgi:hypothetical protein